MNLRVLFAIGAVVCIGITGAAFITAALTVHAYVDAICILLVLAAILYGLTSDAPEPGR